MDERLRLIVHLPSCALTPAIVKAVSEVFAGRTLALLSARDDQGSWEPYPFLAALPGYLDPPNVPFEDFQTSRDARRQRDIRHKEELQLLSQPKIEYLVRREGPISFEEWESRHSDLPRGNIVAIRVQVGADSISSTAILSFGDWNAIRPRSFYSRSPRNDFWVMSKDKDWARGFVSDVTRAVEPAYRPWNDRLRSVWSIAALFAIAFVLLLLVNTVWNSEAASRIVIMAGVVAAGLAGVGAIMAQSSFPIFEWCTSGEASKFQQRRNVAWYVVLLILSLFITGAWNEVLGWLRSW